MIKFLISDFFRVLLFPKNEKTPDVRRLLKKAFSEHHTAFSDLYNFNEELLREYKGIKDRFHLHTSIYTSSSVADFPEIHQQLNTVFDEIFSARSLGFSKSDAQGYTHIIKELNTKPAEIVFVDDSKENLAAAREVGIQTIQYFSNQQLLLDLMKILE